jgi:hypothetical protein
MIPHFMSFVTIYNIRFAFMSIGNYFLKIVVRYIDM